MQSGAVGQPDRQAGLAAGLGNDLKQLTGLPEQQLDGTLAAPPFAPLPHIRCTRHGVPRIGEGRLLRTLGPDQRTTPVPDRPCPRCGGELTLHTDPYGPPSATCSTGEDCTASMPLDNRGRRVWGRTSAPSSARSPQPSTASQLDLVPGVSMRPTYLP
ncbi:hypothetical protein [Streptomyces mirabilis]|uniref:hypothetical protein n=1 Tax=Streptomyces mirabilis TaxID=68239 RepID=UPI0036611695